MFFEDERGNRAEAVLGPRDCVSGPVNVVHGFQKVGLEPACMQVMLGKVKPDLMAYADLALPQKRDAHLAASH